MKKVALSLLALAVVGASAFADAPKWDPKVSTGLTGNASVTFGYDLDTGAAAFSNATSVSLFVDLISGGDAVTKSDKDVWGEIRVFTDGDPIRYKADGVSSGTDYSDNSYNVRKDGFDLKVDYAKIHFGKDAYLSVTSYGTNFSYVEYPDLAFVAYKRAGLYGNTVTPVFARYADYGQNTSGGFEVGYTIPNVAGLVADVGSTDSWSVLSDSTKAYGSKTSWAAKGELSLLAVPNVTFAVGADYSSKDKSDQTVGAKVGYKLMMGDKAYVKPYVNVTATKVAGAGDYLPVIVGGLIYALDGKSATFDNYGLKLDQDWGGYPGVAVAVADKAKKFSATDKSDEIWLNVSANSGALVANTSVVGALEIADLNGKDNNGNGIDTVVTVGASTSVKQGDVTFAPKGTLNYESDATAATAVTHIYAKASSDITGVIPFVTFTVNYESNDFSDKANVVAGNTKGKFEFTTKISF